MTSHIMGSCRILSATVCLLFFPSGVRKARRPSLAVLAAVIPRQGSMSLATTCLENLKVPLTIIFYLEPHGNQDLLIAGLVTTLLVSISGFLYGSPPL